jgi:hypothetical protein
MTTVPRVRAILGVDKDHIPEVLTRAQLNHDAMDADKVTYASPDPPLPVYQTLIGNVISAQQRVSTRAIGAAALRNVDRDLLYSAMCSQCSYTQSLADASPGRAVALIQNAGLLVAGSPAHGKPLLSLRRGVPSGTVIATAHVRLLLLAYPTARPRANRILNWQATFDVGETFATLPSTPKGKTTLRNLTPATRVGVRVNLDAGDGPGAWSQTVTILVH